MKKTTIKTNKRKLVARVMLLVLLLTSALNLGACGRWYPHDKYILSTESDQFANDSQIRLIATSNTKIFSKNDITFNLSYAMFGKNVRGETTLDDKGDYYVSYIDNYEVSYGIYITDMQYDPSLIVNNLEEVNNHLFINQVSESEALSEDYARIYPKFALGEGGSIYNHTETVTIPKEFVSKKSGTFMITVIAFILDEENSCYQSFDSSYIEFNYRMIDENTIEIDMDDYRLYFVIP